MNVSKDQLIDLFHALGCKTARHWTDNTILERMTNFHQLFHEEMEVPESMQKLFNRLLQCARDGKEAMSFTYQDYGGSGSSSSSSSIDSWGYHPLDYNSQSGSSSTSPSPEPPAACGAAARKKNLWGARLGTKMAQLDAFFLAGRAGTVAQIAREMDIPYLTVTNHLQKRKAAGLIKNVAGTWRPTTLAERRRFLQLTTEGK